MGGKATIKSILVLLIATLLLSACQSGSLLFQDDFSDPASGWLQGADPVGEAGYWQGNYRIHIIGIRSEKLSVPRLSFGDVRIDVDAVPLGGPEDNLFGVLCRYQDVNNFYFFKISSDGYYTIGKRVGGKMALLGMDQMLPHDAIHTGQTPNHLRAECVSSTLTFYVNNVKIAQADDQDIGSGDVGLVAGSLQTPGTDILFDNFTVTKP